MITIENQTSITDFSEAQTAFLMYRFRKIRVLFLVCCLTFLGIVVYEIVNNKPFDIISWGFLIYAILLVFCLKRYFKHHFKRCYNNNSKCREFYTLSIDEDSIIYKAQTYTERFATKDFVIFKEFENCLIICQAKNTNAIILYKSAMVKSVQGEVTLFFKNRAL